MSESVIKKYHPHAVEYFFAAIDLRKGNQKLIGIPVSPYFRTAEEAKIFRDRCRIEGVYCISSGFFCDDDEHVRRIEDMVFGGDRTKPAEPITYMVEEVKQ